MAQNSDLLQSGGIEMFEILRHDGIGVSEDRGSNNMAIMLVGHAQE